MEFLAANFEKSSGGLSFCQKKVIWVFLWHEFFLPWFFSKCVTSLRGPVPHRVADSDLLSFYYVQSITLYISLFFTGQRTFCSLPFLVQSLLCFLAHCPCSAAHCRSCLLLCRAEGNRTPLPVFYEKCCPLYYFWTGSWNLLFNSQSSTWSPDQKVKKKYKNFTWYSRLRWSIFLRKS